MKTMILHVYHHFEDSPTMKKILKTVLYNQKILKQMSKELDDLVAEVESEATVQDSVLALVNKLVANQADPAKLQAIVADMAARKQKYIDAVVANT